ncbi:MAG TPA: hypothetical protein VM370_13415 [Candidatus Thermoplasmatota archaeon]|nr:hypothetical protein [Candidatus Thermoplasmatota archaeon]
MRFSIPDALAAATIAITMMRAGIETQAGEAQALGYPWWTFLVAAMGYGLVTMWALVNEQHWVLLVACILPGLFALIHLDDLRQGHATVWATLVLSIAGTLGQVYALR